MGRRRVYHILSYHHLIISSYDAPLGMSLSASILPGLLGDGALLMPSVTVAHMARPMRRSNEGVSVEEGTGRGGGRGRMGGT